MTKVVEHFTKNRVYDFDWFEWAMVGYGQHNTYVWQEVVSWLCNASGSLVVPYNCYPENKVRYYFAIFLHQ